MIVKLNARTVESLKPTSKRMDYHDTEARGLTLRVTSVRCGTTTPTLCAYRLRRRSSRSRGRGGRSKCRR